MSFKKTFFKNILVTGGYNYISQLIVFLSSFITARLLLPENYGLVGLITVFTNFISVFSDSGISLAVIKSDYGRSYYKGLDTLSIIIGVALFFLTSLLAWPIASFYGNHNLILPAIVLSLTFITRSMSIVRAALLSKALNFNDIGKITLINTIVSIILTIILAYLGAEHWSIIIPQIVTSIIAVVYYEHKTGLGCKLYPFKYAKIAYKHTQNSIKNLLGFNLINYWARNSDNLIVGKFYGVNDLGIYNRAYSLLTLPLSLVTGLMGTVLYPSLKKLKSEGGDINKEYVFVLKIISILVYPIASIFILFPEQLVSFLWGQNWLAVGKLLPYFGLLIFGQSLLSTTGNILVLLNKEKKLMISGWVSAFFTIAGISIGAYYSLVGIAQFYSLSFILFVLPFNMIFIFYKALAFNLRQLLLFWLPVILLSLGIWFACFYDQFELKLFFLFLMLINLGISSGKEIKSILTIISNKISPSKTA
ncbi:oligosaccharide flippase family protein [Arcticibacter eurypsychrophilus]|uniref:oligosaccharide flippase family protein n=1 Tax=Arcticibacter eurypsychrophilus TaxID=1434752 RepID=UPI00084D4586|nr:oligosaccharide flippase family protein [Arcticibacter eurypsychrophilus]